MTFIPSEIQNVPLFLALGTLSAMLFSMAKSGFGGSVGFLAVLMMVVACGKTTLATGIMLPMLIAADYAAIAGWLGKWNWRAVWMLLPGSLAGIAAGWAVIHVAGQLGATPGGRTAEAALKLGVGMISLAFLAVQVVRWVRGRALALRPVFWQGTAAGTVAGFTSTLAHAAGPVVTMYLLPQQMPKGQYVATTALYFWIGNQVKLVPYFGERLIRAETLTAGLVLLPGVAAGAVLGLLLHKRVNQKQFDAVVNALLGVVGAGLVYDGVGKLLG